MGGVDSFDQRRAAFDMRLKSRRTWISLFQFLLDVTLVNTVILSNELQIMEGKGTAEIRMSIAHDLIAESRALKITSVVRRPRVGVDAPVRRLDPANHSPVKVEKRQRCELCKIRLKRRGKNPQQAPKSFVRCTYCDVALCVSRDRRCFEEFHNEEIEFETPASA